MRQAPPTPPWLTPAVKRAIFERVSSRAFSRPSPTSKPFSPGPQCFGVRSYDAGSRITQVTFPEGVSLFYSYSKTGQVVGVVDVYGKTTAYQYSSDRSLAQVIFTDGSSSYSFGYSSALGRLTQVQFPSSTGIVANYAQDKAGRLVSLQYLTAPPTFTISSIS